MNDAEAQLAGRLAQDLERVLGTGILIEGHLEIQGEGPVTINVACLVDGRSREIHAEGQSRHRRDVEHRPPRRGAAARRGVLADGGARVLGPPQAGVEHKTVLQEFGGPSGP